MKSRASQFAFAAVLITGTAFAQPPTPSLNNTKLFQPDNNPVLLGGSPTISNPAAGSSFQVVYATAFNQGTESIKVINTGTAGGSDPGGDMCVNVYVFDTGQNLQDCCFCKVSPNGLGSIPLNNQFNSNAFSTLVIKLVATYPGNFRGPNIGGTTCDASTPSTSVDAAGNSQGTAFDGVYTGPQQFLAPGMSAWLDTTPFQSATHGQLKFDQSTISKGEAAKLAYQCGLKHGGMGNGTTTQCAASICQ